MKDESDIENTSKALAPTPQLHKHTPLNFEIQEMRFLVLNPHFGEPDKSLECHFSYEPLETCTPYTAVVNSRGNPSFTGELSIEDFEKRITGNIIWFLRHIRKEKSTVRLWFRDCCLDQNNPEEMSRYWTPQWMQNINIHARDIIDLSEVMAAFWDKGELLRYFTPRQKSWMARREANQPKHYPMPIGSWRGWDAPPTPLQHLPLDYFADEIRLINLWSAQDKSSPLIAGLAYTPMHDGTIYHALSYTWGQEEANEEISLNGQTFFIRNNLAKCLRTLRFTDTSIVIWIDTICIDQNNILEKNRQLPRMLEIYEAAEIVLSWVGEADDASKIAVELANDKDLKSPKLHLDKDGIWEVREPESFPRRLAALYRFLLRPYFRRAWVIQEIAASSSPTINCDGSIIGWQDLDRVVYHLIDVLHADPSMFGKMIKADPKLNSISSLEISFVRRLSYFRHLRVRGKDSFPFTNDWVQVKDDSPGILDAVILARDFQSTSPHDKIFAVWNLAQDTDNMDFTMDYSKSLSQTYLEFTKAVAKKNASLDVISAAEPFLRDGLTIPSWCPDWSTASTVSSMVRHDMIPNIIMNGVHDLSGPKYSAAGSPNLAPRFNFVGDKIECAGAVYDKISLLSPYQSNCENTPETFYQWLSIAIRECRSENEDLLSCMSAFWSMLAGDMADVWTVEEVAGRDGVYNVKGVKQREVRYQEFWAPEITYRNVTRGRRLMITDNGFMGLAPWYAQEGQELAILSGSSAPVLLHDNEDGTYRFVGSCFVQGWMEGEMLDVYGSKQEEAWDKIEALGRLQVV